VPYQTTDFISYIALVAVEQFWNEWLRLQITPL
jgi:hypothetical protein